MGNDLIEWFLANVGLRQGCVMWPRLFNVYMDRVVREVNVRVLLKWQELLCANGSDAKKSFFLLSVFFFFFFH